MKKVLLALISGMALIISCNSVSKNVNGVEIETLVADSVTVNEILNPSYWEITGDEMWILSQKTSKALYRYKLPEWTFVDTVFAHGEGPNDVGDYPVFYLSNNGSVWMSDFQKGNMKKLSLNENKEITDSVLNKTNTAGLEIGRSNMMIYDRYVLNISKSNVTMDNLTDIKPEYIYCKDMQDSMRVKDSLLVYEFQKIEKQSSGDNIISISIRMNNSPLCAVLKDKVRLVYPFINGIQMFNIDENGKFSDYKYVGEEKTFDQISKMPWEDIRTNNTESKKIVGTTEDYIFMSVFQYETEKTIDESGAEKEKTVPKNLSVIAYTWDMEPVKEFVLDKKEASTVKIDPVRGKIYAWNGREDFENVYIYSYKLK